MQIGPYTLERELGRGGMGRVYLARAPEGSPVALKLIHPSLASQPEVLARFRAEGEALERLRHENLVALRGRGSATQGLWLAMDYVPGQTLAERLKSGGPLASPEAGELLLELCAGLQHAHAQGVLHRDLKPANVILRQGDGRPLILDFGLALPLDVSRHLTATGEILGSPGYLAPEQCGAKGQTTPLTDVYGLGAVLYATLTGRPPCQGATVIGTLDAVLNTPPRDPREWVPEVDAALASLCLRCLAKDPSERYASVAELAAALREEPARPARSKAWLALGSSGVGLAGLSLAGLGLAGLLADPGAEVPAASRSPAMGLQASPAPSPSSAVALASAQRALEAEDWEGVHAALVDQTSLEAVWLRYLALGGELRATGQAGPAWPRQREAALARARRLVADSPQPPPLARAVVAALEAIRAPFGSEETSEPQLRRWVEEIRPASHSTTISAAQRRELIRVLSQLELRRLKRGEDARARERAAEALERWKGEGADPWLVALAEVDLASARGAWSDLSRALDAGEALAGDERPWRRLTTYFLRESLVFGRRLPPPEHLTLSRTILAAPGAPRRLRVRVAMRSARALIMAGRGSEALEVLAAVKSVADIGSEETGRADFAQALAEAHLAVGDPSAARQALEAPGAAANPRGQLLEALARLYLGERAAVQDALRQVAPQVKGGEERLFLIEALALAGAREGQLQRLVEGVVRERSVARALRLQGRLEHVLRARGADGRGLAAEPGVLRRGVAEIRRLALNDPEAVVRDLLFEGRWRWALRWIQAELGEGAASPKPRLATRLAVRALERGRQEEPVLSPAWRDLRRVATRFAERTLSQSANDRGLLALLELSEDPLPERLLELVEVLATAVGPEACSELYEGYYRALSLNLGIRQVGPSEVEQILGEVAGAWAQAHPQDLGARYARACHLPPVERSRLLGQLAQQSQNFVVAFQAARDQTLLEVHRERLQPARGAERLSSLTNDRCVLQEERRDLLLLAAELLLFVPGHERAALATLERIDAWCGPPPRGGLRRYQLARSKACAGIPGREREALELAQRALAGLGPRASPRLRAELLTHLGRVEVGLGQRAEGAARIREALALAPGPETWLALARVTAGQEQRRCYVQALGWPAAPGSASELVGEILAAGHDPAAVCSEAFRFLEARGEGRRALILAQALANTRVDAATGRLLCEGYLVASMMFPEGLGDLSWFLPHLETAQGLVEPRFYALFQAAVELLEVRARAGKSPAGVPEIEAALERLLAVAKTSPEDARTLRVPLAALAAYQQLCTLVGPAERARYEALDRRILEDWVRDPAADLRAASWLSRVQLRDGDFAAALASVEGALERSSPLDPQLAELELARAIALSHLDRGPESLAALERSRRAGGAMIEGPASLTAQAQVELRAGALAGASASIRVARSFAERAPPSFAFEISLLQVRILLAQGQAKAAREALGRQARSRVDPAISPSARAIYFALQGEFARRGGRLEDARVLVDQALRLGPRVLVVLEVEVELVLAEEGAAAAARAAEEAAALEGISPRARRVLRERAQALRGE